MGVNEDNLPLSRGMQYTSTISKANKQALEQFQTKQYNQVVHQANATSQTLLTL